MNISPDHLTYEEHSFIGSNLPRPENPLNLYIVQRKLSIPTAGILEISKHRNEEGKIPMGLISAILDHGDLLMNLEDLDSDGRTIRSPRIYTPSDEDFTSRVYKDLLTHPIFAPIYRTFLRV